MSTPAMPDDPKKTVAKRCRPYKVDWKPLKKDPEYIGKAFRTALHSGLRDGTALMPMVTLRELTMIRFINEKTDLPDWTTKVSNKATVDGWKKEALKPGQDLKNEMTQAMFLYCIAELKDRAKKHKNAVRGAIRLFDGDVHKSDSAVSDETRSALQQAVRQLEDVAVQKDLSRSGLPNAEVLKDLVDPSFFPLVFGKTRVLPVGADVTTLEDCINRCGEGEVLEYKFPLPVWKPDNIGERSVKLRAFRNDFQWLPCEVDISGERPRIITYINNLHPQKHGDVYRVIEDVIDSALPLWGLALAPQVAENEQDEKDEQASKGSEGDWEDEPDDADGDGNDDDDGDNSDDDENDGDNDNDNEDKEDNGEKDGEDGGMDQDQEEEEGENSGDVPSDDDGEHESFDPENNFQDLAEALRTQFPRRIPYKTVKYIRHPDHYSKKEAKEEYDEDEDCDEAWKKDHGTDLDLDAVDVDVFEAWRQSRRIVVLPEPPKFKALKEPKPFDLKSKYGSLPLQIVVKLVNIELTAEHPEYAGVDWGFDGTLNERICASALYFYSSENIATSGVSFRHLASENDSVDMEYPQGHHEWLPRVFGLGAGEPCVQEVGSINALEGRLITYSSLVERKIGPVKLADPKKRGHLKMLALFLVDPNVRIISTADVPCQRRDWWAEVFMDAKEGAKPRQGGASLQKLPVELKAHVVNNVDGFPLDIERARKYRVEMEEGREKLEVQCRSVFEAIEFETFDDS